MHWACSFCGPLNFRLYLCLSNVPLCLWDILTYILRCFGPLCLWWPPWTGPGRGGRSTGCCRACAQRCLFSFSTPIRGVGRGGIKIASYCSAHCMDSYGLKLYSGTNLLLQPFTVLRYQSDFIFFLNTSMEEFGIITYRYCNPLSHCCILCCFTFLQACHSALDICSRLYSKYKMLTQEQLIKILPVVCPGTKRI